MAAFHRNFFTANKVSERPSWDLIAVLYAVRGLSEYFLAVTDGKCVGQEDGKNQWIAGVPSNQAYLEYRIPPKDLAAVLEDLLLTPSSRERESDGGISLGIGAATPETGLADLRGRVISALRSARCPLIPPFESFLFGPQADSCGRSLIQREPTNPRTPEPGGRNAQNEPNFRRSFKFGV